MEKEVLFGIDAGTSSVRTVVFSKNGEPLFIAQEELTMYYPEPGWVEQDPVELYAQQLKTILAAFDFHNAPTGIGLTNQRETTIVWERESGKPIYPAIVWQDRRTEQYCNTLKSNLELKNKVQNKTGLPIDPYFSATKIKWILDNVPSARTKALAGELAFGTVESWLLWNFSQRTRHVIEASNASRTLLYNLHTGTWDNELLALFDIPAPLLPEILPSVSNFVKARVEGFPFRIAAVLGDQQAALFGQTCFDVGAAKNTYGTGCFMLMNIGDTPKITNNGLLTTVAWQFNQSRTFALEGAVFNAGTILQLLQDWGILSDVSVLDNLDSPLEENALFLVPAFSGLGAPYWDGTARGAILGITRGSTPNDINLAGLAAIAYQTDELIDCFRTELGSLDLPLVLKVDGGISRSTKLLNFQAKLGQINIQPAHTPEITALGVALLAGFANGLYSSLAEVQALFKHHQLITPQVDNRIPNLKKRWKDAVSRSQNWVNE